MPSTLSLHFPICGEGVGTVSPCTSPAPHSLPGRPRSPSETGFQINNETLLSVYCFSELHMSLGPLGFYLGRSQPPSRYPSPLCILPGPRQQ